MKYKQLLIGFTLGAVLCSTASIFALDYVVNQNPFPILVNGTQKEVGALNVNNSTYIKLSDAGEALGTKVAFNSDKKQIEIGDTSSTSSINPKKLRSGQLLDILAKKYPDMANKKEIYTRSNGTLKFGTKDFELKFSDGYLDATPLIDANILSASDF